MAVSGGAARRRRDLQATQATGIREDSSLTGQASLGREQQSSQAERGLAGIPGDLPDPFPRGGGSLAWLVSGWWLIGVPLLRLRR